jgi:GNAT superfamily N-acetyltransferase
LAIARLPWFDPPTDQRKAQRLSSTEPATLEDLPQLCDLLASLFEDERDFAPDRARQEAALRAILAAPETGRIFVRREGGRVVAMASLLFVISTAEGGRVAWLEDVVVVRDRRGTGVGRALVDDVVAASRALGCRRLTLLTDDDNARAQRLYARAGFVRSRMVPMRLKLNGG